MGLFTQRIQGKPELSAFNGRLIRSLGSTVGNQFCQHATQVPAQRLGLEELPFVELWTVSQREALQVIPSVDLD